MYTEFLCEQVWFIVFNATFNNILVSVLLVEETGVPGENHPCHKSLTNFIT